MALDGVLLTRLLPPQLPVDCVERQSLVAEVVAGLNDRLVTVVAGAGYGKTTLVTQALAATELPWVWCSCDGRIAGTRSLLAHVSAAIARRFPGFGADLSLLGGPDDQILELANEVVETVPDDFVVVLDDVHLLPGEARPALGLLVEHLGPNVHFVLAGRAPLPFSLGALRLGRVLEIGESRLSFDPDESRQLLSGIGTPLPENRIRELCERTEGWVAGLVLAGQSGAGDVGDGTAHFEYLAEEVVLRQPEDVRGFLEDTSVLGRFTPEMAAAVTGHPESAALLADLVARHLFTVRLDGEAGGEWYRYHHLLRDFMRARLAKAAPERWFALHRRAATWWLEVGEPTEAVPHLLAAGDDLGAVHALAPVAERLALGPHSDALAGWLHVLPKEMWEGRPELLLAHASLLLTRAEHEASFAEHERAIGRLIEVGDHDRAAAALFRLQVSMLLAGTRPSLRAEIGRRWRDRIRPTASLLPAARLLLASAYGYDCRFAEAREELAAALALPSAERIPGFSDFADVIRGFYIDFWQDRPKEAADAVGRAATRLRATGEDPLSLLPFATMLHSYLTLELGDFEQTLEAVEVFFDQSRKIGVHRSGARSAMWVRSSCQVGLGRWDDLERDFAPAPEIADPSAGTSYAYRYRAPAARLAARRGHADQMRAQVVRGRTEMEDYGRVFDDATFLCDYALAAADIDPALAASCADEAIRVAGHVGSSWLRARSALVAARCERDPVIRDSRIAEALDITERWDLAELWTHRERLVCPPLLARAIEAGIGSVGAAERLIVLGGGGMLQQVLAEIPPDAHDTRARLAQLAGEMPDVDISLVDQLLRDRDPGVREAARRSWARLKSRPRAALAIQAFGEMRVARDGIPVPGSAFARQKARALLARLIAAAGPVHREVLCDDLWADLPADRAAAALRSTLHDLRRAIEPELEAGSDASALLTEGDNVRLAVSGDDRIDVFEFQRLVRTPDFDETPTERLNRLRAAVALYKGLFLAEWPYEEWASRRRDEFEADLDGALEELVDSAMEAGASPEAVAQSRRLVQRQPQREGWHRLLMRAYARDGDRAMALRQFHACRAVLRREQGIEPSAETRALYNDLLREGDEDLEMSAARGL